MRVDPLYNLALGSSLNDIKGAENSLSSQLSSGLRVSRASDDPAAASQGVALGSAIARDDAYVQATAGVTSRLQVADSALGSVVTQLTSAIALAVKGTDGTLNASDLQAVAQQMSGLRDEVVSLANTSYAGQYLFSGTSGVQPYNVYTLTYQGDAQSQTTATPSGQSLTTGLAGSAIFSASGANVLGALNSLISDFASGTVSANAVDHLNELRDGLTNVSAQRGILDASLNTLHATSTYAQNEATTLTASQSSLVAADTASIATQLSAAESQQQALISVISAAGKYSLFSEMG